MPSSYRTRWLAGACSSCDSGGHCPGSQATVDSASRRTRARSSEPGRGCYSRGRRSLFPTWPVRRTAEPFEAVALSIREEIDDAAFPTRFRTWLGPVLQIDMGRVLGPIAPNRYELVLVRKSRTPAACRALRAKSRKSFCGRYDDEQLDRTEGVHPDQPAQLAGRCYLLSPVEGDLLRVDPVLLDALACCIPRAHGLESRPIALAVATAAAELRLCW
jgi:hypothetical protein